MGLRNLTDPRSGIKLPQIQGMHVDSPESDPSLPTFGRIWATLGGRGAHPVGNGGLRAKFGQIWARPKLTTSLIWTGIGTSLYAIGRMLKTQVCATYLSLRLLLAKFGPRLTNVCEQPLNIRLLCFDSECVCVCVRGVGNTLVKFGHAIRPKSGKSIDRRLRRLVAIKQSWRTSGWPADALR